MSNFVPSIASFEEAAEHHVDPQDGMHVETLEKAFQHALPTSNERRVVLGTPLLRCVVYDGMFRR